MFDINFYMKSYRFFKKLGEYSTTQDNALEILESCRSKEPVVYCIGTTNKCNMRCVFCPRTRRLPKVLRTMDEGVFENIVQQLSPWSAGELESWRDFCVEKYGILPDEMNENHFFLYIISKVIQLHLYGDPLLDKNIAKHVQVLSNGGFQSYFSCNPANIDLKKVEECFDNGLGYIKFSIESVDDITHKQLRGNKSNFLKSYEDICKLLDAKKKNDYKTTVVITMLDLNRVGQQEEYKKLRELFQDKDVYLYLKSEDTMWFRKDYHATKSIHWIEPCKQPWLCMAIDPFGQSVECMESNSSEIVLGNTKEQSLYDIWNGEKYRQFRRDHVYLNKNIRCFKECDMKMVGRCL